MPFSYSTIAVSQVMTDITEAKKPEIVTILEEIQCLIDSTNWCKSSWKQNGERGNSHKLKAMIASVLRF